jgi:hypothetical protein
MPKYNQKKMCSDCPFRKKSIKGWLGPWTAEELQNMIHGENTFICHQEINDMSETYSKEEIEEDGEHCVGFLRYRNQVCKRSRDQNQLARQDELKEIDDQEVLGAFQLVDHHKDVGNFDE